MTGRTIVAEEMHARGVINYIYPRENFIEKATEFAQTFAAQLPDRLLAIKQLTQEAANGIIPALQAKEAAALGKFYRSKEGQEKIQAFYNKSLEKK
jgi:enoyl-CoA hydratase/carnithine racemase